MAEREHRRFREVAHRAGLTLSEWVRQTLRAAVAGAPAGDVDRKKAAVREAVRHAAPTADIDQMLREIRAGYLGGPP